MDKRPYLGLVSYEENDADYFFGRDAERRVISANLKASRLTLLYGESGVGKSSVLRAAVTPYLRADPSVKIVVFHAWHDDPLRGLVTAIRRSLNQVALSRDQDAYDLTLACHEATMDFDGSLLIILDQFEEYFQYSPREDGPETFAVEFPRVLNGNLPVNFLLAIREDALAALDRFKGQISNPFENYLRIRHLDRNSAREAILRPIDRYNLGRNGKATKVVMQAGLADRLVDELLDERPGEEERVEAPYLQLVMARWWDLEVQGGSRELRYETLLRLGGVNNIFRQHLKSTMDQLTLEEQAGAAKIFRLLVTPSGRKTAQTIFDLTKSTDLTSGLVESILEALRRARILTVVALPRTSRKDDQCYEFAHDVVAKEGLEWQQDYEQRRRARAATGSGSGRRYQVFISSTWDLAEERKAAIEAVFERGHIPIAIERFSPSSAGDLEVIRKAIGESHVFLQILGHRYGSLVPGRDVSFTELEYDIAQEHGLITLTFILRDDVLVRRRRELDPGGGHKSDKDELENAARLQRFHRRVSQHFKRAWEPGSEFKFVVELALVETLERSDKPGFIREPHDLGMLEAASNEFVVDIVRELRRYNKLYTRVNRQAAEKRALAEFFGEQYLDRILLHGVSLYFESGSTLVFVAKELASFLSRMLRIDEQGMPSIQIYTNNVLAYLLLWLVNRIPCSQFPWGPPDESSYGASLGSLGRLTDRMPDYSGRPLDEAAKWEINQLLGLPFTVASMKRPALLLGSVGGLQLGDDHVVRFSEHLTESTKTELLTALSTCYGPHVGSFHNKVFKRFLYATQLPIMIFRVFSRICGSLPAPVADPTYGTGRFPSTDTSGSRTPFWWSVSLCC